MGVVRKLRACKIFCRYAGIVVSSRTINLVQNHVSMLRVGSSYQYGMEFTSVSRRFVYGHVQNLTTDSEPVAREIPSTGLDYIFDLVQSSFLYITSHEGYFPPMSIDGKEYSQLNYFILSLPFLDKDDNAQIEQWNDLVASVSTDYKERRDVALRGKCTYEDLCNLVRARLRCFDYEDGTRLDVEKLVNLVAFVYDFCMLTMMEADLDPSLSNYIEGTVTIRKEKIKTPLSLCASTRFYLEEHGNVSRESPPYVHYELPEVNLRRHISNPHANDSYVSAMFADLMHKFFLTFGLKKRANAQWSKPEKMLLYDLLRLFGLCKSSIPAEKSTYITTLQNEYGDYFSSCNLRTWVRRSQAYDYLMGCSVEELIAGEQSIHEPFLNLDDFSIVLREQEPSPEPEIQTVSLEDIPPELRKPLMELSGQTVRVNQMKSGVCFTSVLRLKSFSGEYLEPDHRLDYVLDLIRSSFDYTTVLPAGNQILIVRQDLNNARIWNNLIEKLKTDLLDRIDAIPRDNFAQDDIKPIIFRFLQWRYDWIDTEKFYILFLFIYDYVLLTYKESVIHPQLRLYVPSQSNVAGKTMPSSILVDDMLTSFLEAPTSYRADGSVFYEYRRALNDLQVTSNDYPLEHPAFTSKRMTAMFYDLFVRALKPFDLKRRSDVKYVSASESRLIGELAIRSGICSSKEPDSARRMFLGDRNYFEGSSLETSIRENEYGYLMLNTLSERLFEP